MPPSTTARKKPGRPKGSKTRDYVEVECETIPAVCPTCGSENIKVMPGAKKIEEHISGITTSGLAFNRVTWQRSVCECGQHISRRTYYP